MIVLLMGACGTIFTLQDCVVMLPQCGRNCRIAVPVRAARLVWFGPHDCLLADKTVIEGLNHVESSARLF